MTDVLILHRIRGLRPGAIVPLDDSLEGHILAGNAKLLPNGADQPADEARPAPVLTGASTSSSTDDVFDYEDAED